jgi:hypothetical protein
MNETEKHEKIDYFCDKFDFCGCGMPADVVEYVYKSLLVIDEDWKRKDKQSHDITYPIFVAACNDLYKSDGEKYFMWYWLDNQGYTEHGGGVPGWLTNEGKEVLKELSEFYEQENS